MDLANPPDHYWHCMVEVAGQKKAAIVNDLGYAELEKSIILPWRASRPFTVSGTIVRSTETVTRIRIVHTPEPQSAHAARHNARMESQGVADMATNRRALPFAAGEDLTFPLLFEGPAQPSPDTDLRLIERVCKRLPYSAGLLASRRQGKLPFLISDEYDVQDLLQAVLRAYVKYSVQEDPLPKVAGAKSGRADVSIEELGVLIEVKYARGPNDQKRIFEEFSQDLLLYTQWQHLRTLIFFIYNAGDLRDPEALEKLAGRKTINEHTFEVLVVLS